MKTVNYIFRVEPERTAGGARMSPGRRILTSRKGKVVDLAAWKAENLMLRDETDAGDQRANAPGRYGGRRQVRRRKLAARDWAELAVTLAVAAAFAALAVRVLLF